ncbi:MAG: hypothetical protein JWN44_1795 [Myxococcales bacterium]|nr:hypothetical protein [Myxococcales bacterium]
MPRDSLVAKALDRVDYSDAFVGALPTGITTAEQLARAIFDRPVPMWVRALFAIRTAAARLVGLETGPARHRATRSEAYIPIGRIYATRDDEVLFGLDDKHLDFRAAVLIRDGRAMLATTVKIHGALGRFYFALVKPFHGAIVRRMLARARPASN